MRYIPTIIVLALCACSALAQSGKFPVVTVAADGTGDYGPSTPGTVTSGIQEALNACAQQPYGRDLYIKGGATYDIGDTIHIPATQDFRIEGGIYTLNWTGPAGKDMLWIDSGMDCHFFFGALKYGGSAAAVRFKPVSPVPIDGFAVFIDSEVRVQSIRAGVGGPGTGVAFDPSSTSILMSDCTFGAIEGLTTGIDIPATGQGVSNVRITCRDLHTGIPNATLLKLGANGTQNTVKVRMSTDPGGSNVKGVDINGSNNDVEVSSAGGFAPGYDVLFSGSSSGNKVRLIAPSNSSDPTACVTDASSSATNQLTWVSAAPADIRTFQAGNTGTYTYTQRLFPATARVVGGAVSSVYLIRGATIVSYSLPPVELSLSVGDQLQIESTSVPTIYIIPRANG